MDAGRTDEAAADARRSLQSDPARYMSHYLLGVIAQQHGRCDEAIGHFERAIEAKRLEPHAVVRNLHAGLADCLARTGREAAERPPRHRRQEHGRAQRHQRGQPGFHMRPNA